jgi:hypothetical protein
MTSKGATFTPMALRFKFIAISSNFKVSKTWLSSFLGFQVPRLESKIQDPRSKRERLSLRATKGSVAISGSAATSAVSASWDRFHLRQGYGGQVVLPVLAMTSYSLCFPVLPFPPIPYSLFPDPGFDPLNWNQHRDLFLITSVNLTELSY